MSGTDFYYEEMVTLAEKLSEISPGDVERRVSFGNSGAEAMEGAISWLAGPPAVTRSSPLRQLSRTHHGRPFADLQQGGAAGGFGPLVPGVVHAPYPLYCCRCPFGQKPESCAVECVKHIEDTLLKTIAPAKETAAIVMESVQGEGGYIVPPRKFFDELARVAGKHGILLVFDEVQCGMGRNWQDGQRSISMPCPISSRWPAGSPAGCRWAPPWRATT